MLLDISRQFCWPKSSSMARFDEAAPKVIIIGAGVAGLACFEKLLADGVAREDEILILESRDRPLGRVATSRFAGVPVDVGAAWIHGTDGNPIAARAPPVPPLPPPRRGPNGASPPARTPQALAATSAAAAAAARSKLALNARLRDAAV